MAGVLEGKPIPWTDEQLAPAIKEGLIRAYVQRRLAHRTNRRVLDLVYQFRSWTGAYLHIRAEEAHARCWQPAELDTQLWLAEWRKLFGNIPPPDGTAKSQGPPVNDDLIHQWLGRQLTAQEHDVIGGLICSSPAWGDALIRISEEYGIRWPR